MHTTILSENDLCGTTGDAYQDFVFCPLVFYHSVVSRSRPPIVSFFESRAPPLGNHHTHTSSTIDDLEWR